MKDLVLAGGTATRLFPVTIVTNKHLLPVYDRPMIYYPLATLAGMGIREVMVVMRGKGVGDAVELLGDGSHFGLDLTYRYQRGALETVLDGATGVLFDAPTVDRSLYRRRADERQVIGEDYSRPAHRRRRDPHSGVRPPRRTAATTPGQIQLAAARAPRPDE
jgi:CTP:molybdopterin cytidylyltransferase MocA